MRVEGRSRERLLPLPLLALLALGALLRVGYLQERRAAPDFHRPEIDAGFHDDWARSLAFGGERADVWRAHGFDEEPYLRPPGYPFLLAAVYRLSGGSPTAAVVVQMGLGLVSIALAWAIARRFGGIAALLAGGVMATHWAFVFFEGELHAPPLLIALQLGLVLALLRAAASGGRVAALGAGALLGLGALTRPNVLAELVVVLPWIALAARRRGRPALAPAALVALGTALAIAPVTVRNFRVSGELVPITSNLGVNLWLGNHAGADGRITDDLGPAGRFKTCYDWPQVVENLERDAGRELTTNEVSGWFRARALEWIGAHPGEFVALTLRKAALFWGPAELAHNKDVAAEKRHSTVLRFLPFPFPLLAFAAFAGLGLYVAGRRSRAEVAASPEERRARDELVVLVAGLALVFFLSVLPFFAAARYRVPVLPWLALLAGLLPSYRAASATGRGLALGVAALLVALPWATAPDFGDSAEKYHLDRGRALYNAEQPDAARVELERALELGGGSSAAQFEMGVLEQRVGNLPAARQRYEACLRKDAGHYLARFNLGFVYEGLQDVRAAIQSFRSAADLEPTSGAASFHQGRLLAATGRIPGAIEALRTACDRDPEEPLFANVLARYLVGAQDAGLRDVPEGLRLAETLPADGAAAATYEETRARAYAAAQRPAEARAAITRALDLARAGDTPPAELARLERVRADIAAGLPPWKFR